MLAYSKFLTLHFSADSRTASKCRGTRSCWLLGIKDGYVFAGQIQVFYVLYRYTSYASRPVSPATDHFR